ncbi:MAG: efflux RND transporter periplasmic adaptor subunit [Gemmatimonadota bacterium]
MKNGQQVLLLLLLAGCGAEIDSDRAPVSLEVQPATAATASADVAAAPIAYRTVLYSEHDAIVTARKTGVVRATLAELGDAVAANEVLAILDDEREAAALQSAEAALELARAQHARATALQEQTMITQTELDSAIYKHKAAEAAVRDARTRLDYTRIRAPFGGRIAQRSVRVGQTVSEGDPAFRVTAPRPLRASIRLPELQARALTSGSEVSLRGIDGVRVSGRVARIAPAVDPASGTIELLVDVAQPRSLRPGSTVDVEIRPAVTQKASR